MCPPKKIKKTRKSSPYWQPNLLIKSIIEDSCPRPLWTTLKGYTEKRTFDVKAQHFQKPFYASLSK